MAESEMIERMARAIHGSLGYGGKWPEPECAQCMETARAALAAHLSHLKDSGMVIVPEAEIARAERFYELYERVHIELEDKPWEEIDIAAGNKWTYESWLAYMQQSLINSLRSMILWRRANLRAALSPPEQT